MILKFEIKPVKEVVSEEEEDVTKVEPKAETEDNCAMKSCDESDFENYTDSEDEEINLSNKQSQDPKDLEVNRDSQKSNQ